MGTIHDVYSYNSIDIIMIMHYNNNIINDKCMSSTLRIMLHVFKFQIKFKTSITISTFKFTSR